MFIADLVRELDLTVEVDFLEASSYGDAMESSREVRILKDLRGEIEGRDVLVVEDIVDTGHTLAHVHAPARLPQTCALTIALLDKPSAARPTSRPTGLDSKYRMNLSWAMASTMPSETAICPVLAKCGSPERSRTLGAAARFSWGSGTD